MGRDKGSLVYPQLSQLDQRSRSVNLLEPFCERVFVSCRKEQLSRLPSSSFDLIPDSIPDEGPASGILSAHDLYPDVSWLVLACDFPFSDEECVERLIAGRNRRAAATCYQHSDGTLEPLFAIWEPAALRNLDLAFAIGERSPRRVLELGACSLVPAPAGPALLNVNEPLASLEMR